MRYLLLLLVLLGTAIDAKPRQIDPYRWEDVKRIVAIGDLHGDYDSYQAVLRAAGVIDRRGRWIGGDTHLVQTGDIPDRGPGTRRIIADMRKLAREAEKRGGRVHNLMGNHEAMNVQGDLRYVTPEEFGAFAGKRSAALRDRYFAASMTNLERDNPTRHAALPADYRAQWNREHPLGWVEHRMAWDPRWDADGDLFRWTMQTKVAIQLNDLIFLHGGIGSAYCGNTLASLSKMAHMALRGDPNASSIVDDQAGPLWYRGLAGVAPAARSETVDAVLAKHGARHLVIGHTTTGGLIWPRLAARVILIDAGMSAVYGRHLAWLEVTREGLFAGYPRGRLPLPRDDAARSDYLDAVIALHPDNAELRQRRDLLRAGQGDTASIEPSDNSKPLLEPAGTTCGISR